VRALSRGSPVLAVAWLNKLHLELDAATETLDGFVSSACPLGAAKFFQAQAVRPTGTPGRPSQIPQYTEELNLKSAIDA